MAQPSRPGPTGTRVQRAVSAFKGGAKASFPEPGGVVADPSSARVGALCRERDQAETWVRPTHALNAPICMVGSAQMRGA